MKFQRAVKLRVRSVNDPTIILYVEKTESDNQEHSSVRSTVCPKVAYNSFHMVFSAISGWILKPFDLQVATMCGFDIMYDKPVLPSKVPPCKWITFRHDLEKIRFLDNPTSTVWLSCSCTLARLTEFWDVPPSCWCSSSSSARVTA